MAAAIAADQTAAIADLSTSDPTTTAEPKAGEPKAGEPKKENGSRTLYEGTLTQ